MQSAHKLSKTIELALDYLLYLPPDYASKKSWPLILFLHGVRERGNDVAMVTANGLPRMIEEGKNFPFVIVSPQCPAGEAWVWKLQSLLALVDEIVSHYKIDPDRVYVTGLSMGGFGTWGLAAYAPDRFAAILPICGGGEPTSMPRLKRLPIWTFHGAKDDIVPIERTQELVDALRQAGGNVKFTIYEDVAHDSWTPTYENPEVYKWLLEQKRSKRGTK